MEADAILCWYPHGLSNRLHCIVNGLYLQEQTKRPVYTYWPLNEHLNTPAHELLECPLPQLTEDQVKEFEANSTTRLREEKPFEYSTGLMDWVRDHPGRIIFRKALVECDVPIAFVRETLRDIKWVPAIISQFQTEKELYKIDRSVVGMHVRGMDHNHNPTIRRQHALHALKQEPPTQRIYLATDDIPLQKEVQLDQILIIPRGARNTPQGNIDAVVELLLLAETTFRYHSSNSTYSWVALALSDVPDSKVPRVFSPITTLAPRIQISSLPGRFDWKVYQRLHADLSTWGEPDLISHYLTYGFNEFRVAYDGDGPRIAIYSIYPGFDDYTHPLLHALCSHGFNAFLAETTHDTSYTIHIIFGLVNSTVKIPTGKYIAVQLEQWGSAWFTTEYLTKLRKASVVWEFSKSTVPQLRKKSINAVHVPLGRVDVPLPSPVVEDIDVLFFGSMNSHRQEVIRALQMGGLKVHIVTNVYSDARNELIRRAKLVVNIHYYNGACLEQLRVIPCLAYGKLVISEESTDPLPIAEFVKTTEDMVEACKYWLEQTPSSRQTRALELYQQVPEFKDLIPWASLRPRS
jgi:hypothetical protein